ncbi:MAG: S8 family serine peptidase [Candidatus Kapabacteria bacterium]|jgi:subtilisin family serine protease|nr:S8 family serine peptidase [Candidatus Kapabacteria bacterium]
MRLFIKFLTLLGLYAVLQIPPQVAAQSRTQNDIRGGIPDRFQEPVITPRYEAKTLLVKFKASSATLQMWQGQQRKGSLRFFEEMLGKHSTEALFDDGLVNAVVERFSRLSEENPFDRAELLTRWCKVRYESSADALVLAAKLRRLPEVEFAEPSYLATFTDTPNDPLLGQQTYLRRVQALEAWDVVQAQGDLSQNVVIAVVDSGVDYLHEDLAANIYVNPGESGLDAQGRDKRTNGVDDDRNGRVDDWRGWDFAGTDGQSEDNDPMAERNDHGTHVAGIAAAVTNNATGVAGVARNVKILPVKVGIAQSRFIFNGFRAIMYAAAMGAQIINCSWGDPSLSQAEQETVNIATELGSLIVSTAGNNNQYTPLYPGSYKNVCSVVWLEENDTQLSGNYHETADIGAPGTSIYATFGDNRYGGMSGSSMAAPVVSGAAALVRLRFPRLSPQQVLLRLKAGADANDRVNPNLAGFLGIGRLNVLNAVQTVNPTFIEIQDYTVQDENRNGQLESGETVTVSLRLANSATPVNGARIAMRTTIDPKGRFYPFFTDTVQQIPALNANETRANAVTFRFRLTTNLTQNFPVPLLFSIYDANNKLIGRDAVRLLVNRSYQTLDLNDFVMTVNSRGNFGFNDYPFNSQGDGAYYKQRDTSNLLYEGGLIVARAPENVSSSLRENSSQREQSFVATSLLSVKVASDSSLLSARATFEDLGAASQAGVRITQDLEQYRQTNRQNLILSSYTITNSTTQEFTNLAAGLFFDWDIGTARNNETYWDNECRCGIARNLAPGFPVVGVKLLSPQTPTFYPITFGDTTQNAVTLDLGFPRSDKYKTLTNGLITSRKTGDVTHVVGATGITLQPSASVMVRFGIAAGLSIEEVRRTFSNILQADTVKTRLYPNPVTNSVFLEYELAEDQTVTVELLNALGQVLATVTQENQRKGAHQRSFAMDTYSNGLYFVRFRSATQTFSKPVLVSR